MTNYRRAQVAGGTYFFTVNLAERHGNSVLIDNIELLRSVTRQAGARWPFEILATVILPDHLHAIWRLPEGDHDFASRWSRIKSGFSRAVPAREQVSASRRSKRERGIWQRRYWEHLIRDEDDLRRHIEYIHYNPVKHGHVSAPCEWPHSSFHRYVERGFYTLDWGASEEVRQLELE